MSLSGKDFPRNSNETLRLGVRDRADQDTKRLPDRPCPPEPLSARVAISMKIRLPVRLALLGALFACTSVPRDRPPSIPMDIHSHSEPERVRVTHASLELEIDHAKKE